MNACTEHQYVTDINGRNISRGCVHCGEARWFSVAKAVVGIRPSVPAQTPEQVANAAEWAALNKVDGRARAGSF